jgi:heparan-sulfate lyase
MKLIPDFRKIILLMPIALFAGQFMNAAEINQIVRAEMDRFNERFDRADLDTSAKTVLGFLKLDYPGLEDVREAYEVGDYDAGIDALLDYFRNDKEYIIFPEETTQTPYRKELADLALNHVIKGNKNFDPVYRGTRIDWVGKAVLDGEVVETVEWLYQYHRLYWWTFLAKAYEETGDEDYFYEWRYELVTYTDDLLPLSKKTLYASRRGMETYGRCNIALKTLPYFIKSDLFDAKLLRIYLAFFHHQAEHIRQVYSGGGNHLLGEVTQVFNNGLFFPELKKSDEWIHDGLSMVPGMMKEMVYDEGMNKELVFSYHVMYCELFHKFYQQAEKNGYADQLPDDFYDTLKGLHDIKMIALFPDGSTTQFGDAWKYTKLKDASYAPRYASWIYDTWVDRFPDEPHYKYLQTNGAEGEAWEETCFRFEESGFHFFRNEWSRDAIFMPVKYGPKARGHNQPDNGTFSLSAYGRDFMVDSGSYVYNSDDPEEKALRQWFRRSASHQTLTLNYGNVSQLPEYMYWENQYNKTVAVVDNHSYEGLTHRRTIIFLEKLYFIIHDEAIGDATGRPAKPSLESLSAER